jgi:hypothetical protein
MAQWRFSQSGRWTVAPAPQPSDQTNEHYQDNKTSRDERGHCQACIGDDGRRRPAGAQLLDMIDRDTDFAIAERFQDIIADGSDLLVRQRLHIGFSVEPRHEDFSFAAFTLHTDQDCRDQVVGIRPTCCGVVVQ